ncbi:MFS transporter [Undibacterium sp.]|uniref:MFS transporter n=1 Tax=Undibacterium sp. TaxID=1914977 RepID=UPI00374D95E1
MTAETASATAALPTAITTPATTSTEASHPLRSIPFRLWLTGGTISLLGDQFYLVALPWLVLQQTGSAVAMGGILMAGAVPRAVLMLFGGVLSDRVSSRKIMMATAAARALCVAAIGALAWLHIVQVWQLYALAFAFGVADAFAAPAQSAYLPALLEPEQLVAASSISQGTAQLASIAGPAPAGLLINVLGVASGFFADALSFLAIIAALCTLPDPPKTQLAHQGIWTAMGEAVRYVSSDVPLRSLMLLASCLNFCITGPVSVGLAYVAKQHFDSPVAYGVLVSAVAAGGLIGAVLAGVWQIRKRGAMILLASALLGLCLGAIGLLAGLWSIAAVLLVMGVTAGVVNIHIGAWIMQRIEAAMRGRVASVLMLACVGLMPVSLAVTGLLVAWNLKATFLLAGAAMLAASAAAGLQKPVRQIA